MPGRCAPSVSSIRVSRRLLPPIASPGPRADHLIDGGSVGGPRSAGSADLPLLGVADQIPGPIAASGVGGWLLVPLSAPPRCLPPPGRAPQPPSRPPCRRCFRCGSVGSASPAGRPVRIEERRGCRQLRLSLLSPLGPPFASPRLVTPSDRAALPDPQSLYLCWGCRLRGVGVASATALPAHWRGRARSSSLPPRRPSAPPRAPAPLIAPRPRADHLIDGSVGGSAGPLDLLTRLSGAAATRSPALLPHLGGVVGSRCPIRASSGLPPGRVASAAEPTTLSTVPVGGSVGSVGSAGPASPGAVSIATSGCGGAPWAPAGSQHSPRRRRSRFGRAEGVAVRPRLLLPLATAASHPPVRCTAALALVACYLLAVLGLASMAATTAAVPTTSPARRCAHELPPGQWRVQGVTGRGFGPYG